MVIVAIIAVTLLVVPPSQVNMLIRTRRVLSSLTGHDCLAGDSAGVAATLVISIMVGRAMLDVRSNGAA